MFWHKKNALPGTSENEENPGTTEALISDITLVEPRTDENTQDVSGNTSSSVSTSQAVVTLETAGTTSAGLYSSPNGKFNN